MSMHSHSPSLPALYVQPTCRPRSTFLKLLCGEYRPSEGSMFFGIAGSGSAVAGPAQAVTTVDMRNDPCGAAEPSPMGGYNNPLRDVKPSTLPPCGIYIDRYSIGPVAQQGAMTIAEALTAECRVTDRAECRWRQQMSTAIVRVRAVEESPRLGDSMSTESERSSAAGYATETTTDTRGQRSAVSAIETISSRSSSTSINIAVQVLLEAGGLGAVHEKRCRDLSRGQLLSLVLCLGVARGLRHQWCWEGHIEEEPTLTKSEKG